VQALSRAFGDAYLKSSAQFEGVPAGSDGYSSGFGLTCEPYITVEDVKGVLQCYPVRCYSGAAVLAVLACHDSGAIERLFRNK